jgi:hypothetical protein
MGMGRMTDKDAAFLADIHARMSRMCPGYDENLTYCETQDCPGRLMISPAQVGVCPWASCPLEVPPLLTREEVMQRTLTRFSGWATQVRPLDDGGDAHEPDDDMVTF